jgi:hypothetical protein
MIMDLKDLEKLFKACRKHGISEMDYQGIKFKLGDMPSVKEAGGAQEEIETDNPYSDFPDGTLTLDQLAFYSSGGMPADDPFRKDKEQ